MIDPDKLNLLLARQLEMSQQVILFLLREVAHAREQSCDTCYDEGSSGKEQEQDVKNIKHGSSASAETMFR